MNYKKLTKSFPLLKSIFEAKMAMAFKRLQLAKSLLDGEPVNFGFYEQGLFESREEFDEFVRNILKPLATNYDPKHIFTYSEYPDCYRIKDQRWGFPFGVKLLVVYIQFKDGEENPFVIDLGAV